MLPDNVLLEIFDLYRNIRHSPPRTVWKWHLLVHVCRRWRQIIFESPCRLDLQILCTYGAPVRKSLSIWPDLPIAINYGIPRFNTLSGDEDNIIAALEHHDRVCYLVLDPSDFPLEKMATAMQNPFPMLRRLTICSLSSMTGNAPFLFDGFLGGSVPRLHYITLHGISFPALPTLLSSASDLVALDLRNMPPAGYISPKAMAGCVATLPRLKTFHIQFQSAIFRPDPIHPTPITRAVLPALIHFDFKGDCEYLEDLVARIDGPQLKQIKISYLSQVLDFQVAQLSKFFDRSVGPEISPFRHAKVRFDTHSVTFDMYRPSNHPVLDWHPVRTMVSCRSFDWQVSLMAQVLSQFSPILSTVVHLDLMTLLRTHRSDPLSGADNLEWLYLLHQFSKVQVLYLSREVARYLARALESMTGEMVAEALSSLHSIYLEDQPISSIEKFVAVRRLSGRPVTVIDTATKFAPKLKCYAGK